LQRHTLAIYAAEGGKRREEEQRRKRRTKEMEIGRDRERQSNGDLFLLSKHTHTHYVERRSDSGLRPEEREEEKREEKTVGGLR
jgi:hypothetical protein